MIGAAGTLIGRAVDSSAVVGLARRMAADSAVCPVVTRAVRSLHELDKRIVVGLRGGWSRQQELLTSERLQALAADSRVVAALWSFANAPSAALPGARATHLLSPILRLAVRERIRMAGIAIIVAVLTHVLVMVIVGVAVGVTGWSICAGLVAAGVIAIWRPDALRLAWKDRPTRRD